ncbi:hypothetical protein [Paenibacillus hubeiensis]|uniref:hypothetical protein n=1 Tax=Paenibacillus hubeiensis TaxID=3077330 RepID=UPI0031BAA101
MGLGKKERSKGKQQATSASPTQTAAAGEPKKGQMTAQEWLPVKDIHSNLLWRKDNVVVCVIRVQPVNIALLSKNEKNRKINKLAEALNGIDYPYQILSIAKPVDLDAFIMTLERAKKDTEDVIRKRLLNGYAQQAAGKAMSGEALERHFYILIPKELGKKEKVDEAVVSDRALQFAGSLTHAELTADICNDQANRDLQFIFNHPNQAAYERSPVSIVNLPPMVFAEEVYENE